MTNGCNSIWFTAGVTVAILRSFSRNSTEKLETPAHNMIKMIPSTQNGEMEHTDGLEFVRVFLIEFLHRLPGINPVNAPIRSVWFSSFWACGHRSRPVHKPW